MTKEDFVKAGYSEEQIEKILNITNEPIPKVPVVKEEKKDYKVTTIYDLQEYSRGQIVKLPDFAEGQPFVARMRRPSLLVMAKKGKIPNKLLATATDLFNGGNSHNANNDSILSDTYDVCEAITEAALVEPTMEEIKNAGLELSDNQLIAIFNYAQRGIEALNNFR